MLRCTAFSTSPKKNAAFASAILFAFSDGKFSGERLTYRNPGKEVYEGAIDQNGLIRIKGRGNRFHGDGVWALSFSGQLNDTGETILNGRLISLTGTGERRCAIAFVETAEALRGKLGLPVTKPGLAVAEMAPQSGTSPTSAAAPPAVAVVNPAVPEKVSSARSDVVNLRQVADDLTAQITLLQTLVKELQVDRSHSANPPALTDLTIDLVTKKLDELKRQQNVHPADVAKYQTPIRPADSQSFPTARKVSESYPPIPYYIAGTSEIGDFWVLPEVSDSGQLKFKVRFIDPDSTNDRVRSEVAMSLPEVEQMVDSLRKLFEWSETAHKDRIRREFEKRVLCVPMTECPAEGQRTDGKSSTELVFHVNDEGITNGAIRRNKGQYVESYNFSIDSGLMLRAYMMHVVNEAKLEYEAGSQTKGDLDKLFK